MAVFPFLAALAGIGFDRSIQIGKRFVARLGRPALARMATLGLAAITFVPQIVVAGTLYPHLLSYYAATVGGLPGARFLGFETTYWCETYARALPYLNQHAQPGDVIWVEDWSHDVLFYHQLQGKLDGDLDIAWRPEASTVFHRRGIQGVEVPIDQADYVVIQYRQTGLTGEVRAWLRQREPVYQVKRWGVPLVEIYATEKN
jgi:hypothetical protein